VTATATIFHESLIPEIEPSNAHCLLMSHIERCQSKLQQPAHTRSSMQLLPSTKLWWIQRKEMNHGCANWIQEQEKESKQITAGTT